MDMGNVLRLAMLLAITTGPAVEAVAGQFKGTFSATFDDDGRTVTLIEPYGYIDDETKEWSVPSGWKVDGASIPRPLWSVIGGPFEGKYRNASVIHDYYCDTKTEAWWSVHRVFYEAMLTSGVDPSKAKVMYLAVFHFGPRWPSDKTVIQYEHRYECSGGAAPTCNWDYVPYETTVVSNDPMNAFSDEELQKIEAYVTANPNVDASDPYKALEQALGQPTVK